jgi:hypothetical protein
MAIKPQTARRFEKSSPVARYWLAQCEGFRVKGPLRGTVEQVVGSGDLQDAEALVVRTAWRRRKIPVTDVDAVVPAARLIVVDDSQTEAAPSMVAARFAAAAAAVARVTHAFGLLLAAGVMAVARAVLVLAVNGVRLAKALVAQLRADMHVAARRRTAAARTSRARPR